MQSEPVGVFFKLQLLHPEWITTSGTLWICRTSSASSFYNSIDSLPINVRTASTRWKITHSWNNNASRWIKKNQGKKLRGQIPPCMTQVLAGSIATMLTYNEQSQLHGATKQKLAIGAGVQFLLITATYSGGKRFVPLE